MNTIFNCQESVKNLQNGQGILLAFEIPKSLQPKLPPTTQLSKSDSNYGINDDWTKIVVHIGTDRKKKTNLPRVIWAKKSWTLKELHMDFFAQFKDAIYRWITEFEKDGGSGKSELRPNWAFQGEKLTASKFLELTPEQQFEVFFPNLSEENWKEELATHNWNIAEAPYHLQVENNSGYAQDCHFCGSYNCRSHCPLPFNSKTTVLDFLHKTGVEDNISFYNSKDGKSDLILSVFWHSSFEMKDFLKHLSSV